eukprot:COSAG04_NODE_360_length_15920_cov_50.432815_18_plen_66_part_00
MSSSSPALRLSTNSSPDVRPNVLFGSFGILASSSGASAYAERSNRWIVSNSLNRFCTARPPTFTS